MPWPVTFSNGNTWQESQFAGFAYAQNFPGILQDVADEATRVIGAVGTAQQLAATMQAGPVANIQRRGRALTGVVAPDPLDASLVLPTKDYRLQPGFAPESGTFSRAAAAYYVDPMGVYRSLASGTLRFQSDPATGENLGALLELARTNGIRNNSMQGAVAGTPGTQPTNWGLAAPLGMSIQIVGVGTESGIDYVDVRFSGTPTATSSRCAFEAVGVIAAATGQVWTHSLYCSLRAGSLTGVGFSLEIREYAGATGGSIGAAALVPTGAPLNTQRFSSNRTLTDAGTDNITPTLRIGVTVGTATDFTLRFGWPQLEQGAAATSPIRTTNAAATRAADLFAVPADATWYNRPQGSFYFEAIVPPAEAAVRMLFQLDDGSASNRIAVFRSTTGRLTARLSIGGSNTDIDLGVVAAGAAIRVGLAYSESMFAASLNGAAAVTAALSVTLPALTTLRLGLSTVAAEAWNSAIGRAAYVPRAASLSALQRFTA